MFLYAWISLVEVLNRRVAVAVLSAFCHALISMLLDLLLVRLVGRLIVLICVPFDYSEPSNERRSAARGHGAPLSICSVPTYLQHHFWGDGQTEADDDDDTTIRIVGGGTSLTPCPITLFIIGERGHIGWMIG